MLFRIWGYGKAPRSKSPGPVNAVSLPNPAIPGPVSAVSLPNPAVSPVGLASPGRRWVW